MKKSIISLILTLCMLISILPLGTIPVFAENTSAKGNWLDAGNYDTSWYDGISATTYYIETAKQLAGFAYLINNSKASFGDATVYITADIDLREHEWTPIDNGGISDSPIFAGTFDGQNHTIANMQIYTAYPEMGLFGRSDGYIQNVIMDNAYIHIPYGNKTVKAVAVLAGAVFNGWEGTPAFVKDCAVKNSEIANVGWDNHSEVVSKLYRGAESINNTYEGIAFSSDIQLSKWVDDYDETLARDYIDRKFNSSKTIKVYDELDFMALLYLSSEKVDFQGYTIDIMADLDMSALKWEPFKTFAGTLNGNNHSIVGLNSDMDAAALIMEAKNGCNLKNLSLSVNFTRGSAGFIYATATYANVNVTGCKVYGQIEGYNYYYSGGIIGLINKNNLVTIHSCINYATIYSNGAASGILGGIEANSTAVIESCLNYGSVTLKCDQYTGAGGGAGGIVGEIQRGTNVTIKKCGVAAENISNKDPLTISALNANYRFATAGGFVGTIAAYLDEITVDISDSYCNAKIIVDGSRGYASGFLGINTSTGNTKCSPLIKIKSSYFGGSMVYIDSNGKETVDKTKLFLGIYFREAITLAAGSSIKDNHCIVKYYSGKNAVANRNYDYLSWTNKKLPGEDPHWFNVKDNLDGTYSFYTWTIRGSGISAIGVAYNKFLTNLNSYSGNIWQSTNAYQSNMPYLNTLSPNPYELSKLTPVPGGSLKITSAADSVTAGKSEYFRFPSESNPTIDVKNGFKMQLQTYFSKTDDVPFNDEALFFTNTARKKTPLEEGDVITMYVISSDKSTFTGTYSYTVVSADLEKSTSQIRLRQFKDKNGNAYTTNPAENRSMYFTVEFASKNAHTIGDYSVEYGLVTGSNKTGYKTCVSRTVLFKLVDEYNIKLSVDKVTNGKISFYNDEPIGREAEGVITIISPNEGYEVEKVWLTKDGDTTEIPIETAYNFSKQGFSFAWKTAGKYTVHATFKQKEFSVVFTGTGCSNENSVTTVLYGEDYSFKIKYETGYSPVGEKPVTVNGKPVDKDSGGTYTVTDNKDAVRINVNTKAHADTALSVEPSATSLIYGESVTITATLKEGATAISNKTIAFYDGTAFLGNVKTDTNGKASYVISKAGASTHTFKAVFAGDTDYNASNGLTAPVAVSQKELAISVNPVTINKGQPLPTLTVSVSGFIPGETAAMLTGFALPTASVDSTVDTKDTALTSFTVKYSGGNATANYKFDFSNTTATITINKVNVSDNDYVLNKDNTVWQNEDITITPANGYNKISADGVNWQSVLTLSNEGESSVAFYLKKADGTVTESKKIDYKLDKTNPINVQVQYNGNGWKSFLNTISFGIFFKENVDVTAKAEDTLSGIKSIEYLAADSEITDFSAALWQQSLSLTQNSKKIVYIKISDNAGNYIICHEGVVVYTDSTLVTTTAEFNSDKQKDIEIEMNLNGNTLKEIKNGNTALVNGTDYTQSGSKVTIKKEYLSANLTGSTLSLTFSFNPMGEAFVGTENAPQTAIFTVTKHIHTPEADDGDCETPIKCSSCGFITTAATTHDFSGDWLTDADGHWHDCKHSVCTKTEIKASHSGGEATCTDKAICEVCSTAYGELDPDNHDLVKTEAKAATHYEVGNIEYYTCADCGKIFSDKDGKNEITLADTVLSVIPHKSSFTKWDSDETDHWHTCSCGDTLDKTSHSFEWITDKEATETENGSKHEECTICHYKKAAVDIPETQSSELPKTGDSGNMVLWIALLFVSGGVLATLGVTKKRRKLK